MINPDASWELQPICPEDFFEKLQDASHQTEDYNHLLARTLNEICQTTSIGAIQWSDGVPFIYDPIRMKHLSLNRALVPAGFYGTNGTDLYLRVSDVPSAGKQGFYCERNGTITALWAKSRSIGAWTLEVHKNGIPITLVSATINGGKGGDRDTDIDVSSGDWLQFYLNGTGVSYVNAFVEIAYRP